MTDRLEEKWNEVFASVEKESITVFSTRKLTEEQSEGLEEFKTQIKEDLSTSTGIPQNILFGKATQEEVDTYLEALPQMRGSDFRLTPPTPYDNSIKKEPTMKPRECPICEDKLDYNDYLARNWMFDDDNSREYWKDLWDNIEIQFPCCDCYKLLERISKGKIIHWGSANKWTKIANLTRFGVIP
ncbi:hypothetical protein LCGC14_2066210 [marine sediment metagenome]|uniref:Uncharacterized protein n=1 Tax=marine sediment metagenome TaxID=412755 RepID=A0A0F9EJY0_9ZZZZ